MRNIEEIVAKLRELAKEIDEKVIVEIPSGSEKEGFIGGDHYVREILQFVSDMLEE